MQQMLKLPLESSHEIPPFLPLEAPASAEIQTARPGPKGAPPETAPDDGSEDFDWSDAEAVVVPAQPAIAVYFNPRGEIVIRQEAQFHPDEDHFVYVGRKNLRPLIERLQQIDCG